MSSLMIEKIGEAGVVWLANTTSEGQAGGADSVASTDMLQGPCIQTCTEAGLRNLTLPVRVTASVWCKMICRFH